MIICVYKVYYLAPDSFWLSHYKNNTLRLPEVNGDPILLLSQHPAPEKFKCLVVSLKEEFPSVFRVNTWQKTKSNRTGTVHRKARQFHSVFPRKKKNLNRLIRSSFSGCGTQLLWIFEYIATFARDRISGEHTSNIALVGRFLSCHLEMGENWEWYRKLDSMLLLE